MTAVVEPNGPRLHFSKMGDTQYGSIKAVLNKTTSASLFRRPTKVFAGALAKAPQTLHLPDFEGANAVPGRLPAVCGGEILDGIGCSGGTGDQDIRVCEAVLAALKWRSPRAPRRWTNGGGRRHQIITRIDRTISRLRH